MKHADLTSMSIDDLWALRQAVAEELTAKITMERGELEERLRQLGRGAGAAPSHRERRPYPQVLPKYRNPAPPHETWSGRGREPRWVIEQLKSGKKMEDFRISLA
jgi:DNA-binding protein H-NS